MRNFIPDGMARDNPTWTMPGLVGRLAPGATPDALERGAHEADRGPGSEAESSTRVASST